jgi:hypothetical protein
MMTAAWRPRLVKVMQKARVYVRAWVFRKLRERMP